MTILSMKSLKTSLSIKKALVFDFDGVLADSVAIKTVAFAKMYRAYGKNIVDRVVSFHEANGGISRYEKFRIFETEYLQQELSENRKTKLSEEFSSIVVDEVIKAKDIPYSTEFLQLCQDQSISCFINSATPQQEIIHIANNRNIARFMTRILGSPNSKTINLESILASGPFEVRDIAFFGDAESDKLASDELGIEFIGVGKDIAPSLESSKRNYFHLNDFQDLI